EALAPLVLHVVDGAHRALEHGGGMDGRRGERERDDRGRQEFVRVTRGAARLGRAASEPGGLGGRRAPHALRDLCVPSQNGGFVVCLQPHRYAVWSRSWVKITGLMPALLRVCEPSQNGWYLLSPHAHHA